MKFKLSKSELVLAIGSVLLGLGMAGTAQADAYSFSNVNLDAFQILGSAGQGTLSLTTATRTAAGAANFQGYLGQTNSNATNPPGVTTYPVVCAGPASSPCPGGPGSLPPASYLPAGNSVEYSRADSYAADSPLTTGATARSLSEISMKSPGFAVSDASLGLTGVLKLSTAETLQFTFNASRDLVVTTSKLGDTALASILDVFNVQCYKNPISGANSPGCSDADVAAGLILFQFSPNGVTAGNINGKDEVDPFSLNLAIGSVNGAVTADVSDPSTRFSLTSDFSFGAGEYLVNLALNSHADVFVSKVPEPGSLALMGLGLLGVGVSRRRKATK